MEFKRKPVYLIIALFGLAIIIDSEYCSSWKTVDILRVFGEDINGSRRGGGEYVIKVDVGYKTIVVNPKFSSHLRKMDKLEIHSSMIFRQIDTIKIPLKNKYILVPLEFGIKNGYYVFPVTMIIAAILAFISNSHQVRAYSFATSAIIGLFIMYVLFLN